MKWMQIDGVTVPFSVVGEMYEALKALRDAENEAEASDAWGLADDVLAKIEPPK